MKNSLFLIGILSLLLGVGTTYAIMSREQPEPSTTSNTAQMSMSHEGMSGIEGMNMDAMSEELRGKTGDEFDKSFISMMIEHHLGAIDMAEQAQANAKHEEIKSLADDIVAAQNREIEQMKDWQQKWGY